MIVADNASTDDSVDYIKLNFPSIILIQNEENLGFAKGNNLAMEFALDQGADYILLLNNDTAAERDMVEKLLITAESDNSIGIVGPMVFDIENKSLVHEAGMMCDKFGYPIAIRGEEIDDKQSISEVFFVSGSALMIKQEVLKKIGFFDEEYFMFAEDLDLCWRAQLAGYEVVVNRTARVYHASGGSITGGVMRGRSYTTDIRRIFLRERNTIRTMIKNYNKGNLIRMIPLYLASLSLECILWTFLLKPRVSICLLKAVGWNIRALPDTIRHRQSVQKLRKISDQHILEKMIKGYGKILVFKHVGIPCILES